MASEPIETAVTDVRALLWQFQKAGLRDLHLRSPSLQVFLARQDGTANPMFAAVPAPVPSAEETPAAVICAPHLGMFEPLCAVGERIAPGSLVARIDVLGRKTDVHCREGGRVMTIGFAANDLVEFGEQLFTFVAA